MQKPRDTRTAILETSRDLFIDHGYAATSMSQVARKVGITKATIYHHFKDKRSLMDELVAQAMTVMAETLDALARESVPSARLAMAARRAFGFLSRNADIMQVARREIPGFRESMRTDGGRFLRAYEELISESIMEGRRKGTFRAIDPSEAAHVFMSMLQGSFAHAMLTGSKPRSAERATAALLEVFLHGIAAAPSRTPKRSVS